MISEFHQTMDYSCSNISYLLQLYQDKHFESRRGFLHPHWPGFFFSGKKMRGTAGVN